MSGLRLNLSKKLYPYCSVLVGSRNTFKNDLDKKKRFIHNQTKIIVILKAETLEFLITQF